MKLQKIILLLIAIYSITYSQALFEIKDASDNTVFEIANDGLRVFNLGDTLMVISASEIKANIVSSKDRALSRSFSVTTATTGKAGLANILEVTTDATTMREGVDGDEYTSFSVENIFLGLHAGQSTSGTSNVFVGNDAGFSNGTGAANVFIGFEAGYSNTDKSSNTYVGHWAGKYSTGNMNAFYGYAAGTSNLGDQNSFYGQNAGSMNSAGSNSCLFGYSAGVQSEGDNNVMIGSRSGYFNQTGSGNVFLGYTSGENETGSNKLYLDNSDISTPLIYGEFDTNLLNFNTNKTHLKHPIGQSTNGLFIQSTYDSNTDSWHFYQATTDHLTLWYNTTLRGTWDLTSGVYTSSSDKRFKKNIEDYTNIIDKVMMLQPKKYNFTSQKDNEKRYIGLIAQDVEKVFPEFVVFNEEADAYTMDYAGMSVVAIQAIKEQQIVIDELKKENKGLNERLDKIEKLVNELK
ncbi:MAG: tail fiber domain-containing protein [Candidatus Delongbacteria bacterium]|nr:tail fiber domain-containing protein [Candidatus Delongbacteria bacterium]